jgi:hypothetical protein
MSESRKVQIHNVLTHGSTGAANGTVRTDRGTFAFCDVYRFNSAKNAKIAEMTTYRIRL